jgi:hypothetical protein
MPGTTPNFHYPYPVDSDLINVAVDIQRLAESIDVAQAKVYAEQGPINDWFAATNTAQDARLDAVEAKNVEQDERITVNRGAIDVIFARAEVWRGEDKPEAGVVGLTLDGNGYGTVAFPANTFLQGTGVVVYPTNYPSATGAPSDWLDVIPVAAAWNGFAIQVATRGTNTPFANQAMTVAYIAVGTRPAV